MRSPQFLCLTLWRQKMKECSSIGWDLKQTDYGFPRIMKLESKVDTDLFYLFSWVGRSTQLLTKVSSTTC